MTIGHARGEDGASTDEDVTYVTYVIGGATLGISKFDRDVSASTADRDNTWYGASFAVNENLSVSAGKSVTNFETNSRPGIFWICCFVHYGFNNSCNFYEQTRRCSWNCWY